MTGRPGRDEPYPLDLGRTAYSYLERPNRGVLALLARHVGARHAAPRVVDVGCGCGANARSFKQSSQGAYVLGVEPNARAARFAREACDEVFEGPFDEWAGSTSEASRFDALVLADVVEHMADPIAFLRAVRDVRALREATWIVSVPNFAVWHNRVRTLLGVQRYAWNGLWDRTHLRFFTRKTLLQLLDYCGLDVVEEASTPSLAQSTSSLTRKLFERRDWPTDDHMALADSEAYSLYRKFVEPVEARVCAAWPELLAFQVVVAARPR